MRKAAAVFLSLGFLVVWFTLQRFFLSAQGPQQPLTDSHFCVDANGDGRLDVSDAVTILNFLFVGTSTPYCVAQGTSLDNFATRDDLNALKVRLDALESSARSVGSIATGTYDGDGKQDRVIDTGLRGSVRFVRVWASSAPRFPCLCACCCQDRFDG